MRSGLNPNKDKARTEQGYFHQVVIPVYIPKQTDYFAESLDVFKLCMQSLFLSSHKNTYFTVVNNGSCKAVVDYCNDLMASGKIQELVHAPNIGKVNAILKGVIGHNFDLVTITDADVLFKPGWQEASYTIFKAFPKAAAVSPVPIPTFLKYYNAHLWVRYAFSKQLKFKAVQDKKALTAFMESINNPNFYKPCHLEQIAVLSNKNTEACVGSGHFVNTYRATIFNPSVGSYSNYALGGDSETYFIDEPAFKAGGYRLATTHGFAYHMGNTLEPWMQEELPKQDVRVPDLANPIQTELKAPSGLKNWWVKSIFRLLSKPPFWYWILKSKGLNKAVVKSY